MNNSQQLIDQIKESLDILYDNKNQDIESARAMASLDNETAIEIIDAYEKISKINHAAIGTRQHDILIDIVTSYDNRTYMPGTMGEFLFGCIDVDISDLEQSCRPSCRDAIIRNEWKYRRCSLPTWKYEDGVMKKINDGDEGSVRGLLFVDDIDSFDTSLIPDEIATIELYRLGSSPDESFVGTYRDGSLVKPELSSMNTQRPKRRVTFDDHVEFSDIPDSSTSFIEEVTDSISGLVNGEENSVNKMLDDKPGITQWVVVGAVALAFGLGVYLLYRYVLKPSKSNTPIASSTISNKFRQI